MPLVIIIDCDTALMNSVAMAFPTSLALFFKYHITKNVKIRVKSAVGMKPVKCEDGKVVKPDVVFKNIMGAWNGIINSSTKEI